MFGKKKRNVTMKAQKGKLEARVQPKKQEVRFNDGENTYIIRVDNSALAKIADILADALESKGVSVERETKKNNPAPAEKNV